MAVNGYDELNDGEWARALLEDGATGFGDEGDNGALMTDKLRFVFIEIGRFDKKPKDEKEQYVNNMINERDTYNQIANAREVGMEEGMARGLARGRSEERESIAGRMKDSGVPIDVIMRCTGLDKAAVEALGRDKVQQ